MMNLPVKDHIRTKQGLIEFIESLPDHIEIDFSFIVPHVIDYNYLPTTGLFGQRSTKILDTIIEKHECNIRIGYKNS